VNDSVCCSVCGHSIPPEDRYCGQCGCALTAEEQLAPRREDIVAVAGRSLPRKLKPVGKALAIGAVVVATEVGLAWLSRRTGLAKQPALTAARDSASSSSAAPGYVIGQSLEEVFVRTREGYSRDLLFAKRVISSLYVPKPPAGSG
jgi:hypothetical protein